MIKNRKYLLGLVVLPFLAFCTKDDVADPVFDVSVEKLSYKVNDTVRFSFKGNADLITFYSGEKGSEYKYKDRTFMEGGVKSLQIETRVTYGTQKDNLKLMVSSDFKGIYDSVAVKNATWTDITSKFKLSEGAGLAPIVKSDKVDISDVVVGGKPFFLAFKYFATSTPPPATTTTQRGWRISMFNFTNKYTELPESSVATLTNAGWTPVNFRDGIDVAGTGKSKWIFTNLPGMINYDPKGSLVESEAWVITKAFLPDNIAPDKGVPIKEYSLRTDSYAYTFKTKGVYKVTFVASNVNYSGQKSIVKEVEITVE
uniref:DUF5017 domain-containing protein n=1 Tax=Pedobacter schmidteae TaxID=2201271 RepID=UPI000EB3FFDF|nr:DUF5017 domain-containing protein [Pedobacter schmidteae]